MELINKSQIPSSDKNVCVLTTLGMLAGITYKRVKKIAAEEHLRLSGGVMLHFDWYHALRLYKNTTDGYNPLVTAICERLHLPKLNTSALAQMRLGLLSPISNLCPRPGVYHLSLLLKNTYGLNSGHSVVFCDGVVYDYNCEAPLPLDEYKHWVTARFGWSLQSFMLERVK